MAVAFFQYFYQEKKQSIPTVLLAVLRALALFFIGVLLINPTLEVVQTTEEKPVVAVLVDNSESIRFFNEQKAVQHLYQTLKTNPQLQDKFTVAAFSFGKTLKVLDSLSFKATETDIDKAITSVHELYKRKKLATVLITDGNQTLGNDYEFYASKNAVFPIVVGDTLPYKDLQIAQLNANTYSYIRNTFPVEALLYYEGTEAVDAVFTLTHQGKKVHTQPVRFSANVPSTTVRVNVTSTKKGVQYYQASISALPKEKNRNNNYKNFSVEVIDEQTKVLLLSSIVHPDLGAIKRSIERNQQRTVDLKLINTDNVVLSDYQMYIFYQPTVQFKPIFEQVNSHFLLVTGTKTDWNYVNSLGIGVQKNVSHQKERARAIYNSSFATFMQEDIGFGEFPPLEDVFGKLEFTENSQVILYQKIGGVATEYPLLAAIETQDKKVMLWLGEGIWTWRASSYVQAQTFEKFDAFMGNIAQYLASNQKRKRLTVKAKAIYPANVPILFSAFYVDQNYRFDSRASLTLKMTNTTTQKITTVPFSLVGNSYQVAVEGLETGTYSYEVTVANQTLKTYGSFIIPPYSIEEQFVNANRRKLQQLATRTEGKLFYKSQVNRLVTQLLNDPNYVTVQKSITTQKSLIDWQWVVLIIIFILALEWFIRKYYGKI